MKLKIILKNLDCLLILFINLLIYTFLELDFIFIHFIYVLINIFILNIYIDLWKLVNIDTFLIFYYLI